MDQVQLDPTAVRVTAAACLATTVISGLAPAFLQARADPMDALRSASTQWTTRIDGWRPRRRSSSRSASNRTFSGKTPPSVSWFADAVPRRRWARRFDRRFGPLRVQPSDILRQVLASGMRTLALGMVPGIVGAVAASRLIRSQLFETGPLDPPGVAGDVHGTDSDRNRRLLFPGNPGRPGGHHDGLEDGMKDCVPHRSSLIPCRFRRWLNAGFPALLLLLPLETQAGDTEDLHSAPEWNQWLGGPGRTLSAPGTAAADSPNPTFKELWRRPLGSGYAALSVWGTNAITAITDGKQDCALLLDARTGVERWRFVLGRTRKRAEGVPPGPLSTPAIDAESCYVQALDGRMVCLDLTTGTLRWEVSLKRAFGAHEPGYGFASSPLLWNGTVILLPAGSSSASAIALDCRTGVLRWKAALGTSTEYASATLQSAQTNPQIVAQLASKLVGLDPVEGRLLWEVGDVAGGLWTPLVLRDGSVFFPISERTQMRRLEPSSAPMLWESPVFEGAMGPVVEVQGMVIGHHKRRLTALDASTGELLWRKSEESDGQLLGLDTHLVFLNDRSGVLELLRVRRSGSELRHRQTILKPVRVESPLTLAHGTLYIRTPSELVALRIRSEGQ